MAPETRVTRSLLARRTTIMQPSAASGAPTRKCCQLLPWNPAVRVYPQAQYSQGWVTVDIHKVHYQYVHISSEGRTLIEHGVGLKDLKCGTVVLTCYIASVCGKEFEVYWREPAMKTDMIVKLSMDGQLTDEVAHFEYDGNGESKGVIDFGLKAVRPYRFEEIKTTDDERLAHPGRVSAKLGIITVELFKIERWDECKTRPRFDSKSVVNPRCVHVADSHKIGDRHAVGFGTRRTMREYPYCYSVYKPVGEEKTPFLIFHFKYRPHAVLENQGIVPRTIPAATARKRPPSPSLVTNAAKRSRDDSEGPTEIHDSNDESPPSSPSSGSESSGTSPEPESEEGVSEASVVGQMSEDVTGCQPNTLITCRAAELATIEAQIEKLQEELANKQAALMQVIIRQL